IDLSLQPGDSVALLGASGAGKSTLMAALHDRAGLTARGFSITAARLEIRAAIGVVPQRGALFDHLSVAGNLALAMRNADEPVPTARQPEEIARWLAHLDLSTRWGDPGSRGEPMSGGEAQRVAVARTFAGGRRILLLDEPSVGLDPLRVRMLAAVLRRELRENHAAALVVTHDLHFAAAFADRFLAMDRGRRALVPLDVRAAGDDAAARSPEVTRALEARLEAAITDHLSHEAGDSRAPTTRARGWLQEVARAWLAPFVVIARVVERAPQSLIARARDLPEVARVVLKQGLLRPAPFFAVVSTLVGFTILYIFHRSLAVGGVPLRPDRVFSLIGSMHIIALAPALAGILFVATSGSAITAWLGSMSLTRQTTALQALGIGEARYLWVPAWLGLALSFVALAALFTAGMVAGGLAYLELNAPELPDAFAVITADLLDPPPERQVFRARALALVGVYALGIASDAIAKGAEEKSSAEAVTVAMVRSVMACTLWIVAIELVSLALVYAGR
ncbi:MAG: ATP-binding cassette domain-containing protein, partial [Myxococcales bacterium]|nr:ATP-binding cassette domain-containing protein [Myxococcales bacterium]